MSIHVAEVSGVVDRDGVVALDMPAGCSAQAVLITPVSPAQGPDYNKWLITGHSVHEWDAEHPARLSVVFLGTQGAPSRFVPAEVLPPGTVVRFNALYGSAA